MLIEYKHFGRTALAKIFVTSEEQIDKKEEIERVISQLSQNGYLPIVYRSGNGDIKINTENLLKRNA